MMQKIDTEADKKIRCCLEELRSFSVVAGAGSGKTMSLVDGLRHARLLYGKEFRRDAKQVVCITYTNRAVTVLKSRLQEDELFYISTIHSFLWEQISRFQNDLRQCVISFIIPKYIEKKTSEDNGGRSIQARKARQTIAKLREDLENITDNTVFKYENVSYSRFSKGVLGHDDIIDIASHMICNSSVLSSLIGQKYPIIFVDEAQDTFPEVVNSLNSVADKSGFPVVGYFGDPMQQIFDKRAGDFAGPDGSEVIHKEENFRSSHAVRNLLNLFRSDLEQKPGRDDIEEGSVEIRLVQGEVGESTRNSYSELQLDQVAKKFDEALSHWNWDSGVEYKRLFLVRQMIARRQGFPKLNALFTGVYASQTAENDYRDATHYLIAPFVNVIFPLVKAFEEKRVPEIMRLLRSNGTLFGLDGSYENRSLGSVMADLKSTVGTLHSKWVNKSLKDIISYSLNMGVLEGSERLLVQLEREPRSEEYDEGIHSIEKGDWLADEFLKQDASELAAYIKFINDDTPFSTQHGVKGEEYDNVLTLFDDTEARWSKYNFAKTLTPRVAGNPTEGQLSRSQKIAYVCFSRAAVNLRVIFFTLDPHGARQELLDSKLFSEEQISIG